jgi:hypothetical protein
VGLSTQAQLRVANAALRLRRLGRPDEARNSCSAVFDAVTPADAAPSEMADRAYIGACSASSWSLMGGFAIPLRMPVTAPALSR